MSEQDPYSEKRKNEAKGMNDQEQRSNEGTGTSSGRMTGTGSERNTGRNEANTGIENSEDEESEEETL
jgi:hypothetical protein